MKSKLLLVLLVVIGLTSCSDDLVHTWNIDKYETLRENGKNSTYNNIGTLSFNKNQTGNNNIAIQEISYIDKANFKWEENDGYVLLKSLKAEDSSRIFKVWIVTDKKSKKQIWKSTNGENDIQILELSRN